jgi:hypothetical protein
LDAGLERLAFGKSWPQRNRVLLSVIADPVAAGGVAVEK